MSSYISNDSNKKAFKLLRYVNHYILNWLFPVILIKEQIELVIVGMSKELSSHCIVVSVDDIVVIPTPWLQTI